MDGSSVQGVYTTTNSSYYRESTVPRKNKKSKLLVAIGTEFIKVISNYSRMYKIKQVLIICDNITTHAIKEIRQSKLKITCFTYTEASVLQMTRHTHQPVVFARLSELERRKFERSNPLFRRELQVYSQSDPLVKYMGYTIGDIITIESSDIHSGLCEDKAIVI